MREYRNKHWPQFRKNREELAETASEQSRLLVDLLTYAKDFWYIGIAIVMLLLGIFIRLVLTGLGY